MAWLSRKLVGRSAPSSRSAYRDEARAAAGRDLLFLVSAPRSGSTWTQRALNQHREVFCTEQRLFGSFAQFWMDDFRTGHAGLRITLDAYVAALSTPFEHDALGLGADQFQREAVRVIADALLSYGRERSGKRVVVDKITPYLGSSERVLGAIRAHFPAARIAYLLRDARDVATSGVHDWLTKATSDRPPSEFQRRRRAKLIDGEAGPALGRFFEPEELDTWARTWREPLDAIQPSAELTISFEALKRDQAGELRRLLRLLGVDESAAVVAACVEGSSFQRMSGGRAPGDGLAGAKVRKGVVGDWRTSFTREDGERFHALVGDLLVRHGYAADDGWIEELPRTLAI